MTTVEIVNQITAENVGLRRVFYDFVSNSEVMMENVHRVDNLMIYS